MKKFLNLLPLSLFLFSTTSFAVSDADFDIEGQYEDVTPQQQTASLDKVEVLELFWYGCPHCYHFEPVLKNWLKNKPEYVEFKRMPAIFRKSWMPFARAFYAIEQMGELEKFHTALFDSIHEKKQHLNTKEALADFVESLGLDRSVFLQQYNSFAVDSKARQAALMTRRYGIKGVPSVIVNGKYRSSGSLAGTFPNLIKVISTLAEKEHKVIIKRTTAKNGVSK